MTRHQGYVFEAQPEWEISVTLHCGCRFRAVKEAHRGYAIIYRVKCDDSLREERPLVGAMSPEEVIGYIRDRAPNCNAESARSSGS